MRTLDEERSDVYYGALLRFLGCTADAQQMAEIAGGDEIALRAAIAPALGGAPSEFVSRVMPKSALAGVLCGEPAW